MAELKTRVDELKMENEYQLRLKDMNYNEKIKDLTDKFLQEIDSLKARNEVKTCNQLRNALLPNPWLTSTVFFPL